MYILSLPHDLKLELSLYLHHRDTLNYCNIVGLNESIWLHKIRKELNYSNDFIVNFVDNSLLPVNEKYLELKARKSVDFGCEFYQDYNILMLRSSRLLDFESADQLTHYLLNVVKFTSEEEYKKNCRIAVRGALAVKNFQLVENIFCIYYRDKQRTINEDFSHAIVSGIYENFPNGNIELLRKYNIDESKITEIAVIEGLSGGGHLEQLKSMPIIIEDLYYATLLKRTNIIQHYELIEKDIYSIKPLIMSGNLELLPNVNKVNQQMAEKIIENLLIYGYTEELVNKEHFITAEIITKVISQLIIINHIDVLAYLYQRFPDITTRELKKKFDTEQGFLDMYDVTKITWTYLYDNKLITIKQLQTIPELILGKMSRTNSDAANYLMQFI